MNTWARGWLPERQNKGWACLPPVPGTRGSTLREGDRDGGGGRRGVGSEADGHHPRPSAGPERRRQAGSRVLSLAPLPPLPPGTRPSFRRSHSRCHRPPAPPPHRCAPRRPPPSLHMRASARRGWARPGALQDGAVAIATAAGRQAGDGAGWGGRGAVKRPEGCG